MIGCYRIRSISVEGVPWIGMSSVFHVRPVVGERWSIKLDDLLLATVYENFAEQIGDCIASIRRDDHGPFVEIIMPTRTETVRRAAAIRQINQELEAQQKERKF